MKSILIPFLTLSLLFTCTPKEDEQLWGLLPISPPTEDVGEFTVGPEGGGYLAEDGLSILIPAGAMATAVTVLGAVNAATSSEPSVSAPAVAGRSSPSAVSCAPVGGNRGPQTTTADSRVRDHALLSLPA